MDNSQLRSLYKLNDLFDLRSVRNLFLDTEQSIVLRCIGLVKNTISLDNMFDQCF